MNNTTNVSTRTAATAASQTNKSTLLIIQILCYSVIIVTGTCGNILIFLSVVCRKTRKLSDYFILNLTIADLLCCVVSIPFDIMELVIGYWPLGLSMCKIVYPLQTVLTAVSVVTLLFMALERHRVIVYPFKPKIRVRYVVLTIVLLWVTAFALVTPYMMTLELRGSFCVENWSGEKNVKAFTICIFVLLYVVPLSIIFAVFVRVALRLRNNNYTITRAFGNSMMGNQTREVRSSRNARVLKIFVSAVIAFAVCNLPFHIMWLWNDLGNASGNDYFNDLLTFANIMVYTNSAINPFIFGALSQKFRRFVRKAAPRKRSPNISSIQVNQYRRDYLRNIFKDSFRLKERNPKNLETARNNMKQDHSNAKAVYQMVTSL